MSQFLNSLASSVKKWLKKADFNNDGLSDADQLLAAVDHVKDEAHIVMSKMHLDDIAKAINLITKLCSSCKKLLIFSRIPCQPLNWQRLKKL